MLNSIYNQYLSHRREFAKYFIVGISGFALNFLLLVFLKEIVKLSATMSVAITGVICMTFNFYLNKHWSFQEKSTPHRQIVRYIILSSGDYAFSIGSMYLFHGRLGIDYRLVFIMATAAMVSWNFLAYKYWVYR